MQLDLDDVLEILCFGTKEKIKKLLENGIVYNFSISGEYTILNTKTNEGCRGYGIKNPNCVKYFGNKSK